MLNTENTSNMENDTPMPWWVPMLESMSVTRPDSGTVQIGDRTITLRPENKPTRRASIRIQLKAIIGNRLYESKIRHRSYLGFYRRNNCEVRIKQYDDIEVMAHEMAYYLDFHNKYKKEFTRLLNCYSDVVNQFSYTSDPKLVTSEGFAEYVRLWLTQYDKVKDSEFTEPFEQLICRDPKFGRKMQLMQEDMHRWYNQGDRATGRAKLMEVSK